MTFQDLSIAIKHFMFDYPFYGHLLMKMGKKIVPDLPASGAVTVNPEGLGVDLLINPKDWEEKLSKKTRIGLIHHETLHVAFGHIQLHERFPDPELANVAMDLEINQYIPTDQKETTWLDIGAEPFKKFNFATKKGAKFYYDALANEAQKDPNFRKKALEAAAAAGCSTPGGTAKGSKANSFSKLTDPQKKMFEHQQDSNLKEAAEESETNEKNMGNLPGDLQRKLEKLFEKKEEVFNWKKWFRQYVGSILEIHRKKTPKRDSKRYLGSPGFKTKRKIRLFVSIDVSGSVAIKELADMFEQLHYIWKAGAEIHVITWDTIIHDRFIYDGKMPKVVHGGGGSDIGIAIKEFNDKIKDFTAAVHFTDGFVSNNQKLMGRQLFVITSNGAMFNPGPGQYRMFQIPKDGTTVK